jgi:hypothetical protein
MSAQVAPEIPVAKRFLMTQLWRIQQSFTLLSLLLWGVVISLTAYPVISPVWLPFLQDRFGIPLPPGLIALTLVLLFLAVFGGLFTIGIVYDKYLQLWREQLDVAVMRNPYAREKLSPKEILMLRHVYLPTLRSTGQDNPAAAEAIGFIEAWVEKSIAADGNIRRAVEQAEQWIRSAAPHSR